MALRKRKQAKNPLIEPSPLPHGAPVFDKMQAGHFLPAYEHVALSADKEVSRIANNPEPPTFRNTIEALEWPLDYRDQTKRLTDLYSDEINPGSLKKDLHRISVLQARFDYKMYHNTLLFQRIQKLHEQIDQPGMPEAHASLIKLHYDHFKRFGAHLPEKDRARLKWIATRQANLQSTYTQNTKKKTGQALADANIPIAHQILKLRHQEAQVLGFKTYSDLAISQNEAGTTENVLKMLEEYHRRMTLLQKQYPQTTLAEGQKDPFENLREYFPIDQVLDGLIRYTEEFFDIRFVKTVDKYRVHHPGVRAYEIHDNKSKKILSLYFGDFYTYEGQVREGAAAHEIRSRSVRGGHTYIPIIMKCCTFDAPVADQAPLLSPYEVSVLFHEMGHALQMALTTVEHPSIAGANVKYDVGEVASLLQEFPILRKDVLRSIAGHYQSGNALPEEQLDAVIEHISRERINDMRETFYQSILDIALHNRDPKTITDIPAFENEIRTAMGLELLKPEESTCADLWHLFAASADYASHNYMYIWSAIQAADIYREYQNKESEGPVARRAFANAIREHVYTHGSARDSVKQFETLMGRKPDISAIFEMAAQGIKSNQSTPVLPPPQITTEKQDVDSLRPPEPEFVPLLPLPSASLKTPSCIPS